MDITNNPFGIQLAIFKCIMLGLESSQAHDKISLSIARSESSAAVSISISNKNLHSSYNETEEVTNIVNTLNGQLTHNSENENYIYRLSFPYTLTDGLIDDTEEL